MRRNLNAWGISLAHLEHGLSDAPMVLWSTRPTLRTAILQAMEDAATTPPHEWSVLRPDPASMVDPLAFQDEVRGLADEARDRNAGLAVLVADAHLLTPEQLFVCASTAKHAAREQWGALFVLIGAGSLPYRLAQLEPASQKFRLAQLH